MSRIVHFESSRGVGWLADLKDPDGNIFGALQRDPSAK